MDTLEERDARISVLLIEDTPEHAILVRSYLASKSHISLEIVDSLTEGERLLTDESFDLVLLDLFLPDSSGLATLRRLRQGHPRIPVIVLTGLEGPNGADAALSEGAVAFLSKGRFDSQQLLDSIRSAVVT